MSDLKPDRKLLNNLFDGYKLHSKPLESTSIPLISGVNKIQRNPDRFTYNYVRSHEMQNHLYHDPWSQIAYFIDKDLRITAVLPDKDSFSLLNVYKCPKDDTANYTFSGTLSFPTATLCLVTTGTGSLYLINTGERSNELSHFWSLINENPIHKFKQPIYIYNSLMDNARNILHTLVISLDDFSQDNKTTSFCILHWLQINISTNDTVECGVKGWKAFRGQNLPKSCWFDENFENLLVTSERQYQLIDHLTYEVIEAEERDCCFGGNGDDKINGDLKCYNWHQCKDMVTITFDLCLTESEVDCQILHNLIEVKLKTGSVLLKGNLEKDVLEDASKWYIQNNKLELILVKKKSREFWTSVIPGDKNGIHVIKGEEQQRIDEVHEQLKHLTSDGTTKEEAKESNFNMQQLEDCDDNMDEDIKLFSINVFTGKVNKLKSLVGHQWIFSSHIESNQTPSICLRYDVDGIVWCPDPTSSDKWNHVATFDAFGYVHVSKEERKFIACSPSFKYVVITDCVSHIYVYESIDIGKKQRAQYVATFQDSEQILGCRVAYDSIYVLTDKHVNVLKLPS